MNYMLDIRVPMLNFVDMTMLLRLSRRILFSQGKLIGVFRHKVVFATCIEMVQRNHVCKNVCVE